MSIFRIIGLFLLIKVVYVVREKLKYHLYCIYVNGNHGYVLARSFGFIFSNVDLNS